MVLRQNNYLFSSLFFITSEQNEFSPDSVSVIQCSAEYWVQNLVILRMFAYYRNQS